MSREKSPKFLNLLKMYYPITAVLSLSQRISGLLLTLSLPYFIFLLDRSLQSALGFEQVMITLQQPLASLLLLIWLWAFSLHFWSGIRFLLLDLHIGVLKIQSRMSAWGALILSVLSALGLWGML